MTDCLLVGEARAEFKTKTLPSFPMLLPMTLLTFAWDGFSWRPKSQQPSAGGRTVTATAQHIWGPLKGRRVVQGTPLVLSQTAFPTSRSPKGEGREPTETDSQREAGEDICSLSTSITGYTLTGKHRPGPVLQHNEAISGSPMARCSFLPLRRTRSPHRTSRLAAVPQMGPRYRLGQWSLPWSTAHQQSPQTTGCLCRVPALVLPTSLVQAQPLGLHQHYLTKQALKTNGTTLLAPTLNTQTADGRSCLACGNS